MIHRVTRNYEDWPEDELKEELLPIYELSLSSNEPLTSITKSVPLAHASAARVRCMLIDSGFDGQSLLLTRNQRNMTQNRYGHSVVYTVDSFDSNKGEEIFDCTARRRDGKFQVRSMKFVRSQKLRLSNGAAECERNQCRNGGVCLLNMDATYYCMCSENFIGPHCEHSWDKISGLDGTEAIKRDRNICIGSAVLFFFFLLALAGLFLRERKKNHQLKKFVRELRKNPSNAAASNEAEKLLAEEHVDFEAVGDADLEELYDQADAKPPIRRPTIINEYDNLRLRPEQEKPRTDKKEPAKT